VDYENLRSGWGVAIGLLILIGNGNESLIEVNQIATMRITHSTSAIEGTFYAFSVVYQKHLLDGGID